MRPQATDAQRELRLKFEHRRSGGAGYCCPAISLALYLKTSTTKGVDGGAAFNNVVKGVWNSVATENVFHTSLGRAFYRAMTLVSNWAWKGNRDLEEDESGNEEGSCDEAKNMFRSGTPIHCGEHKNLYEIWIGMRKNSLVYNIGHERETHSYFLITRRYWSCIKLSYESILVFCLRRAVRIKLPSSCIGVCVRLCEAYNVLVGRRHREWNSIKLKSCGKKCIAVFLMRQWCCGSHTQGEVRTALVPMWACLHRRCLFPDTNVRSMFYYVSLP